MQTQVGTTPLVVGQQNYPIVFPAAFLIVPTAITLTVVMPSPSGETFEAVVDGSSLTTTGMTVVLNGVPSSASIGGYISWSVTGTLTPFTVTPSQSGITVVSLFNRVGRRARGGDFTKLSMSEQTDIMEACNAALQRLYNALPNYFKEQTQGFALAAPLAISGVMVTQFSKTVSGYTFDPSQIGCTVALNGDPGWNQITSTTTLLNPYMGPSGTVGGTIYGDAIFSQTYPFDRMIGNPEFAQQSIGLLYSNQIVSSYGNRCFWPYYQNIGTPQICWVQTFGNSQGNNAPGLVLKFAPVPDRAYAISIKMSFWPKRLTLADYDANSFLVVPDQFIEPALIPMCLQAFMSSPAWNDMKDGARIDARGDAGEAFARNQVGQVGVPNNRIFTPLGY